MRAQAARNRISATEDLLRKIAVEDSLQDVRSASLRDDFLCHLVGSLVAHLAFDLHGIAAFFLGRSVLLDFRLGAFGDVEVGGE